MHASLIASLSIVLFVAVYSTAAMPVEGDNLHQNIGGGVPHPSSQRGQQLSSGQTNVGGGVPHPNSPEGQRLSRQAGTVGGGVPYPNSPEGQRLTGASGDNKSVLEGGTQVKPWLVNQPNIQQIRKEHQQDQQ